VIDNYNPDSLTCLANRGNDEVFTPPGIAKQMLDLLPARIWRDVSRPGLQIWRFPAQDRQAAEFGEVGS
jgi:hypothetical protein